MLPTSCRPIIAALVVAGCLGCSGISNQAREQVTYSGSFAQLQANPDQYAGATALLGGKIIQTTPLEKGSTELVVLQLPLGSSDRPQSDDQSQGRFIVRATEFLDPALYASGTLITVVGRMTGSQERTIGEMLYRYPVLSLVEIKRWPEPDTSAPRFHIGIGVGKTF